MTGTGKRAGTNILAFTAFPPILHSLFSCFIALVSCHYSRPNLEDEHLSKETRDSLAYLFERHYTWNTNLEVLADSVNLACLPVKDCYNMLYRGDRVVVAEFAIHPADSVDSVWVKLAHSQEVQGWLRESEMMHAFVPTDSISQAIYLFSDTHASYLSLFCLVCGSLAVPGFSAQAVEDGVL